MDKENQKYFEVSLTGLDPILWKKKRGVLVQKISQAVEKLMDKIIDPITEKTVKEESQEIFSLGLNHIKSRLAKPGVENQKSIVQIKEAYARMEEIAINNRKKIAESEAQEFKNFLNKMEFSLGSTIILLKNDQDEEGLIFIKQMEEWLNLVRAIKQNFI